MANAGNQRLMGRRIMVATNSAMPSAPTPSGTIPLVSESRSNAVIMVELPLFLANHPQL
jgi:hypothetical protein